MPRQLSALGRCSREDTEAAQADPKAWVFFELHQHLQGGLFGKRSASGRRRWSGSGGQATNPAGAIHRLALWVGGLSTAGVMDRLK